MNDRETRRYNMGGRVVTFGKDNAAGFPAQPKAQKIGIPRSSSKKNCRAGALHVIERAAIEGVTAGNLICHP
jgi:hypothetical protein